MIVKMFTFGAFFTNCYVVMCETTTEAVVIDPGFDNQSEAEQVFSYINDYDLMLKLVLNTHGHLDHTCGNGLVKEKYHVPILIHEEDAYMLGKPETAESLGFQSFSPKADALLHDGNSVKFGKCTLKVVHTPGHSRGSITLTGEKEAFTGDTLFADSIGRTDFPGSSPADMEKSLKKLRSLRDDFIVYPGHGPMTTMREEKQNNPFLQ